MHWFDNFLSKVKFSTLYFSTMHILWDRPSQYNVLLIIHAKKVLKSLVYDSWLQVTFVAFMMSKTSYWDGLLTGYLQCRCIKYITVHSEKNLPCCVSISTRFFSYPNGKEGASRHSFNPQEYNCNFVTHSCCWRGYISN